MSASNARPLQTELSVEGPSGDCEGGATAFSTLAGNLTRRERQALIGVLFGLSNDELARRLGISQRTVEIHRGGMMRKMGARRQVELVLAALRDKT